MANKRIVHVVWLYMMTVLGYHDKLVWQGKLNVFLFLSYTLLCALF